MHSTESLFLTNAGPEFHQIIQFIKVGFTSSQSLEKKVLASERWWRRRKRRVTQNAHKNLKSQIYFKTYVLINSWSIWASFIEENPNVEKDDITQQRSGRETFWHLFTKGCQIFRLWNVLFLHTATSAYNFLLMNSVDPL